MKALRNKPTLTPLEAIIVEAVFLCGSSISELTKFCDLYNMTDLDLRYLVIRTAATTSLELSKKG